jgi:hypothetical protein
MTNSKNPWDEARLNTYIGQEEHARLEFKSSKGLKQDKEKGSKEAVNAITTEVVALLNSDGGEILIGLEEEARKSGQVNAVGRAEKIIGVTRDVMDAKKLNQMICDRISPATGSLINVFPIALGSFHTEERETVAFAIEVKAGNTAYQCVVDKRYYGRRGSESVPLDDKDVRLRMLGDDKPRVRLSSEINSISTRYEEYEKEYRNAFMQRRAMDKDPSIFANHGGPLYVKKLTQSSVRASILIENTGNTVINKLVASIPHETTKTLHYKFDDSFNESRADDLVYIEKDFLKRPKIALYPRMKAELFTFSFEVTRDEAPPVLTDTLEINVFLDGGSGDVISLDLASIAKKALTDLSEMATRVESEFPDVVGYSW